MSTSVTQRPFVGEDLSLRFPKETVILWEERSNWKPEKGYDVAPRDSFDVAPVLLSGFKVVVFITCPQTRVCSGQQLPNILLDAYRLQKIGVETLLLSPGNTHVVNKWVKDAASKRSKELEMQINPDVIRPLPDHSNVVAKLLGIAGHSEQLGNTVDRGSMLLHNGRVKYIDFESDNGLCTKNVSFDLFYKVLRLKELTTGRISRYGLGV